MGDQTVGLQARLMSQAMRKLTGNLNRANTICIFTNQIREKVGVMFGRRDPARRPRAQVLRLAAHRHPPHRDPQGRDRGGRQPRAREDRQEQGRAAVPPGRVRHRVRASASPPRDACSTSASSTASCRSPARSSATTASAWARGATTRRRSCARTRRWSPRSRRKIYAALGIERPGAPIAVAAPRAERERQRLPKPAAPPAARAQGRLERGRSRQLPQPPEALPRHRPPPASIAEAGASRVAADDRCDETCVFGRSTGVSDALATARTAGRGRRSSSGSTARAATTCTPTWRRCCATASPPRT